MAGIINDELIDTLWNVNSLERKDWGDRLWELIDTLWNVNEQGWLRLCPARLIELIDTLWNVNLFKSNGYSTGRQELIDTLWNVNYNSPVSTHNAVEN